MKNNKPTLKSLQHELELIKAQKLLDENRRSSNTTTTHIPFYKNIFKKSSMFHLWLITGVLGYARKIPFISKVFTLLSLWYGKTTWWKILVKIRKVFIIFNALIGVLMVYKTVGFSPENILAGFSAMGYTYIEIFMNATKRLFNWFVELFDHKVVPNVPGDTPKNGKLWGFNPPSSSNNLLPDFSLRELYTKNPSININLESNPWYKEWKTWLWVFGAIGTISAIYFGYKFIIDPLFIHELPDLKGKAPVYPAPENPSPPITLTDRVGTSVSNVTNSFATIFTGFRNRLNPFNWLPVANGESIKQFQTFMENQNNMSTADRRFYPFTEVNPILPWYKQLKTQLLGESMSESLQRFKDRAYAERIYNSLKVSGGEFTNVGGLTPNIVGLGIGTNSPLSALNSPIPGFNFVEAVHTVNIENKFNSIPTTPQGFHKPIPGEFLETVGGNLDQWSSHERAPYTDDWFKSIKSEKVATSSKVTLDDGFTYAKAVGKGLKDKTPFKISENKFSVLENIDI